jgi:hypothetical protein
VPSFNASRRVSLRFIRTLRCAPAQAGLACTDPNPAKSDVISQIGNFSALLDQYQDTFTSQAETAAPRPNPSKTPKLPNTPPLRASKAPQSSNSVISGRQLKPIGTGNQPIPGLTESWPELYKTGQAWCPYDQMKGKLILLAVFLSLAAIGLVVMMTRPSRGKIASPGWRFVTNQDGSIGLARPAGDPSWRLVAHLSTTCTNSPERSGP